MDPRSSSSARTLIVATSVTGSGWSDVFESVGMGALAVSFMYGYGAGGRAAPYGRTGVLSGVRAAVWCGLCDAARAVCVPLQCHDACVLYGVVRASVVRHGTLYLNISLLIGYQSCVRDCNLENMFSQFLPDTLIGA